MIKIRKTEKIMKKNERNQEIMIKFQGKLLIMILLSIFKQYLAFMRA